MVLATSPTPPVSSAQLQPSTSMCLRQTNVSSRLFLRVFEKGTGVSDIWELEKQAAGNTSARLEEKKAHFHRNSKHQKSRIYTQKRQDELSAAFRFWSLYSDDSVRNLFSSAESLFEFQRKKDEFLIFFLFWRRELFSWVCVKNEVPETIMWWTFNSFPFGGIFMRVFRPGSNSRKTFVLNPEKTYSINMITAWLCDSDSAENRRVYSWKVNRDTICQRSER